QDSYTDEICGDFLRAITRDKSDIGDEAELDQQLLDGGGIADTEDSPAEAEVGPQPLPSEVEHHPVDRERVEEQNPAEGNREQCRHGRAVHAERGKSELAEDEHVVEEDCEHVDDTADPQRRTRVTCTAQR